MTRALFVAGLLLGLGGCANDLSQLKDDPAAICVRSTFIYGSIEMSRNHGCETLASMPKL